MSMRGASTALPAAAFAGCGAAGPFLASHAACSLTSSKSFVNALGAAGGRVRFGARRHVNLRHQRLRAAIGEPRHVLLHHVQLQLETPRRARHRHVQRQRHFLTRSQVRRQIRPRVILRHHPMVCVPPMVAQPHAQAPGRRLARPRLGAAILDPHFEALARPRRHLFDSRGQRQLRAETPCPSSGRLAPRAAAPARSAVERPIARPA